MSATLPYSLQLVAARLYKFLTVTVAVTAKQTVRYLATC